MKKLTVTILAFILSNVFFFANTYAQSPGFAKIADSLLTNADLVIRKQETNITILGINKYEHEQHEVKTILREKGNDRAVVYLHYDPTTKINDLDIIIYDNWGNKVRKVAPKELNDIPISNSSTIFTDDRVKYFEPNYGSYPYTIDVRYKVTHNKALSFGVFAPGGEKEAVEYAKLHVTAPLDIPFHFKSFGIHNPSQIVKGSSQQTLDITLQGIKAFEEESQEYDFNKRIPYVSIMPLRLSYDNYEGSTEDWKAYGKFSQLLFEGRDGLNEGDKQKIKEINSTFPNALDRMKAIYEYMQSKTRYVNVVLGLGGYQPIPAQSVGDNGYGDCKALTNYLYALYKEAGIYAIPALVAAGSENQYISAIKDFPNFSYFNHVILAVPHQKDTIWLECTSNIDPFGFIGSFTDDRDVLLLTSEGGKWAHTKSYSMQDNMDITRANFTIDATGNLQGNMDATGIGLSYDFFYSRLLRHSPKEQMDRLLREYNLPALIIDSILIREERSIIPKGSLHAHFSSASYAKVSGNYLILPLNKLHHEEIPELQLRPRESSFLSPYNYQTKDTVTFQIPPGYHISELPQEMVVQSKFAQYSNKTSFADGKIIFIRAFQQPKKLYPKEDYTEYRKVMEQIAKYDGIKILLQKN